MTKSDQKPKGLKRLLKVLAWVAVGCAIGLVMVVIIYVAICLRPTGYDEFAADHTGAVERVQAWIDRPLAIEAQPTTATQSATTSPSPVEPPPIKVDFVASIRDLNKAQEEFWRSYRPAFSEWDFYTWIENWTYDGRAEIPEALRDAQTSHTSFKPTPKWIEWIRQEAQNHTATVSRRNTGRQEKMKRALHDPSFSRALHAHLDRYERFLLGPPWETPVFESTPIDLSFWRFYRPAAVTILRAALRGQTQQAARMLENYQDIVEVLCIHQFYNGGMHYYDLSIRPLLMTLGEVGDISSRTLMRIGERIGRARMMPDRVADLRTTYAMRWRDQTIQALRAGKFPTHDNLLQRMLGTTDGAWLRLGRPIVERNIERAALKWIENVENREKSEIVNWLPMFNTLVSASVLNVDFAAMPLLNPTAAYGGDEGEVWNRGIERIRVCAAVAAYRCDRGHYPDRIESLMSQYLDDSFLEQSNYQWAVLTFTPTPPDKDESDQPPATERPIVCRIDGSYAYYSTLPDPAVPPAAAELLRERPEIEDDSDSDSDSDSEHLERVGRSTTITTTTMITIKK